MKHAFTFSDWEHGQYSESAPPESFLDSLPAPQKLAPYSPTWGKYSESAKKASATRNHKRHLLNLELFTREVLPRALPVMDADSLHVTGVSLNLPELVERGGRRLWVSGNRSQWIAIGHPDEARAANIGASPLPTAAAALEYLTNLKTTAP